jgi:integrase
MIWTMAMTGMRPGELFGLRREYSYPSWPASDPRPDPEEEQRYKEDMLRYGKGEDLMPAIRVQLQVQQEEGVAVVEVPPKYYSYRTLVVPPFLAEMLEKLLASHENKWVFPAVGGGNLKAAPFSRSYWFPMTRGSKERTRARGPAPARPAIPRVPEFEGKRIYLIRHGHKAWLDEDGHSRFAVESRMGHEVPGVEGTYSSVTVPMERAIMKALQGRWETFEHRKGGA